VPPTLEYPSFELSLVSIPTCPLFGIPNNLPVLELIEPNANVAAVAVGSWLLLTAALLGATCFLGKALIVVAANVIAATDGAFGAAEDIMVGNSEDGAGGFCTIGAPCVLFPNDAK